MLAHSLSRFMVILIDRLRNGGSIFRGSVQCPYRRPGDGTKISVPSIDEDMWRPLNFLPFRYSPDTRPLVITSKYTLIAFIMICFWGKVDWPAKVRCCFCKIRVLDTDFPPSLIRKWTSRHLAHCSLHHRLCYEISWCSRSRACAHQSKNDGCLSASLGVGRRSSSNICWYIITDMGIRFIEARGWVAARVTMKPLHGLGLLAP